MGRVFVVANNHAQAVDYCRWIGLEQTEFTYVTDYRQFYGYNGELLIVLNGAYKHGWYIDALCIASVRGLR